MDINDWGLVLFLALGSVLFLTMMSGGKWLTPILGSVRKRIRQRRGGLLEVFPEIIYWERGDLIDMGDEWCYFESINEQGIVTATRYDVVLVYDLWRIPKLKNDSYNNRHQRIVGKRILEEMRSPEFEQILKDTREAIEQIKHT
jgi:hypothetical protein